MQTDGDKKIELKPGFYMEHDKDVCMNYDPSSRFCAWYVVRTGTPNDEQFGFLQVGAVVVGFDRYFNYYKVQ